MKSAKTQNSIQVSPLKRQGQDTSVLTLLPIVTAIGNESLWAEGEGVLIALPHTLVRVPVDAPQ